MTELVECSARSSSVSQMADIVARLSTQLETGETVDWEQLINQHSQFAAELRALRPAIEGLVSLGCSANDDDQIPVPVPVGEAEAKRTLGDYEILREIGRGGMAVVFEARQISLDRHVALKMLPFATLANQQQLKRFKNEARAAATLLHPHIVPVFAVGCERGIHYYSMQFIEGPTLADVLTQLRQSSNERFKFSDDALSDATNDFDSPSPRQDASLSTANVNQGFASAETGWDLQADLSTKRSESKSTYFRTVARWGIQVAEALAYAHENGVIHRDIKPANLLLDGSGKLWIADFGLARLEKDASMTMTGDIVGTLRYMAPEQALAKRVPIDHRADVYSLGATLYELFTMHPAFAGRDREELLKQIAFEEPRPPRKFDAAVPSELDTIVLKAIRKNPDERYATAQDLAEDLKAYLDDRPITAKPPTLLQRAAKWSRRHRGVVGSAAVIMVALTVGSLLSTTLLLAERHRTQLASAESKAVMDFLVNEILAAPLDEKKQDRAVTVSEVLANAEDRIDAAFDEQPLVEATVRQVIAKTYHMLRESEKAQPHARRSLKLRTDLLGPIHHDTLEATTTLAEILVVQDKTDEARRLSREALQHTQEALGQRHPDTIDSMNRMVRVTLAHPSLGKAELDQLQEICQRGLSSSRDLLGAEHRHTLTAMKLQADLYRYRGDAPRAEALANQALKLSRRCLGPRDRLTISLAGDAATAYDNRQQRHKAIQMYEEVVKGQRRTLGDKDPETNWAMLQMTRLYNQVHRFEEAQRLAEEGRAASSVIYGPDHSETCEWKQQLTLSLRGQRRLNEASRLQEEVLAWCRHNLGNDDPRTIFSIGQLSYDYVLQDRFDAALPLADEAISLGRKVLAPASDPVVHAMIVRFRVLNGQGREEEARQQFEELPEGPDKQMQLAKWLAEEGKYDKAHDLLNAIEESLSPTTWYWRNLLAWRFATASSEAMRNGQRAVKLATRACELTGYKSATVLDTLATAYAEVGDFESAIKWGEKAVSLAPGFYHRQKYSRHLEAFKSGKPWRRD